MDVPVSSQFVGHELPEGGHASRMGIVGQFVTFSGQGITQGVNQLVQGQGFGGGKGHREVVLRPSVGGTGGHRDVLGE